MRLSVLCASAALATGLVLSACSSGGSSSSALPSTNAQALVKGQLHGQAMETHLMPGVKPMSIGCDYSVYSFCFYVVPGNPGPYVETSASSAQQLYNSAYIVKNKSKKGKPDKKFDTYFYPDPGNPTYQYIDYKGKNPKKTGAVKFTDYYCIGFSPSDCGGTNWTLKLGIALEPGT